MLACTGIKIGVKCQQPNTGMMTKNKAEPSGMNVWSLLQEKSHDLLKCLLRLEKILNAESRMAVINAS